MENTIFYSRFCPHCKDFILLLKKEGLLDYFTRKINIDGQPNLPPFLKEVPTIIVDDYDEPLGSDYAFKWVDFKKSTKAKKQEKESGIESFNGGAFDNYGVIEGEGLDGDDSPAYRGMDVNNLQKDGRSSVLYQETLLPQGMQSAANNDGGGDLGKRLEQMENMRAIDNKMFKPQR